MAQQSAPPVDGEDDVGPGNRYSLDGAESNEDGDRPPECAVCLQTCIHPVELPCHHIFCFLCVKGVANQSKRCALCRHEIPVDFLNNPRLLHREELFKKEEGYQWFYEGRNGWWQYDERTSADLEEKFEKGLKTFDILVAGFLYIVDLENMFQSRRHDPTRRRKIKRDLAAIPKKGIAGIKTNFDSDDREDAGDGGENVNTTLNARLGRVSNNRVSGASGDSVPPPPSNTPQSPNAGSPGRVSPLPEEALTASMSNLSLQTRSRNQSRSGSENNTAPQSPAAPRQVVGRDSGCLNPSNPQRENDSSSDSDWD